MKYLDENRTNQLITAFKNGDFAGKDGITPTIGENGNWFLGDIDTGKTARGPIGDPNGSYSELTTEDKTLIGAMNEINAKFGDVESILDSINGEVV